MVITVHVRLIKTNSRSVNPVFSLVPRGEMRFAGEFFGALDARAVSVRNLITAGRWFLISAKRFLKSPSPGRMGGPAINGVGRVRPRTLWTLDSCVPRAKRHGRSARERIAGRDERSAEIIIITRAPGLAGRRVLLIKDVTLRENGS